MKTKEKTRCLICIICIVIFFSILFFADGIVLAAKITGTVVDENGAPIEGIKVEYGSSTCLTDSSGAYTVEDSGNIDKVKYNFENGEEYEQNGSNAKSITYTPKYEQKDTNYNIVIVKPENGFDYEYEQIEQIMSGCKVDKNKLYTYKPGDNNFYGESGEAVSNPYTEYEKIFSQKHKNLFIVIGDKDLPPIEVNSRGSGESWKGSIFLNTDTAHTKVPKYNIQKATLFKQLKDMIFEFAGIEESPEKNVNISVNNTHALVDITEKDKNQTIKVTLKRKENPAISGNFITGHILLPDRSVMNNIKYGKSLSNIKVELMKIDGGTWTTSVNIDGKYGFERPAEDGEYKVRFIYNGQEFKTIDGEVNNNNIEDPGNTDNNAKEIERNMFNDKFNPIDNDLAKQIGNWYIDDSIDVVNILAETEKFEIKDIPEEGTPGQPGYKDAIPAVPRYINLVLEKREEFSVITKKQINVVKVTLADGQIYSENQMKATAPDEQEKEQVKMRQVIMDEELMHGATIEIEYLITAQTDSNMNIEEIRVIDYLDYGINKLEYNPELKLLSANEKNGDNWQVVTKEDLRNNREVEQILLDDDITNEEIEDKLYLIGNLKKIDEKTFQTKLIVSKLIGSSLENEELIYSNYIEILSYKNSEGRRLKWNDEANLSEQDFNIPGNFNPNNTANTGDDTALAEDVFIIPPFGRTNGVFVNLSKYIEQKTEFLNKEEI